MPYQWSSETTPTRSLTLWPHQSMTQAGFVWFISITAVMLLLPLLAVLGRLYILIKFSVKYSSWLIPIAIMSSNESV